MQFTIFFFLPKIKITLLNKSGFEMILCLKYTLVFCLLHMRTKN